MRVGSVIGVAWNRDGPSTHALRERATPAVLLRASATHTVAAAEHAMSTGHAMSTAEVTRSRKNSENGTGAALALPSAGLPEPAFSPNQFHVEETGQ